MIRVFDLVLAICNTSLSCRMRMGLIKQLFSQPEFAREDLLKLSGSRIPEVRNGASALGQPAGEATPHYPELAPDRLLGMKCYTSAKQEKRLLATPLVQRITESGTQAVAGELEKHPLVIG